MKDFCFCLPWATRCEEPCKKDEEKERKEEEELVIPHLNEDIISNILIRFPTESLEFKFRYICMSWDNIISNPFFRSQHVRCSEPEPGLLIQDLLLDEYGYGTFFIDMKGGITKLQQFKADNLSKILGCSNGLVLLEWWDCDELHNQNQQTGGCRDIWVANLVTKQYLKLPHHQPRFPSLSRTHHGFAFVPSISKFKVVCLAKCYHHQAEVGRLHCMILTLDSANPKWRVIEGLAGRANCLCHEPPISVNGRYLYWCLYYPLNIVISMDLLEEKFSEVRLPCVIGNLVEIEGYLCNVVTKPDLGELDMWVLKDVHGGNWVKQYSIVCHSQGERYLCKKIVSLRNGEITIFDYSDKMLYTYDIKLRKMKMMTKINISGFIEFCSSHVNSYFFSF